MSVTLIAQSCRTIMCQLKQFQITISTSWDQGCTSLIIRYAGTQTTGFVSRQMNLFKFRNESKNVTMNFRLDWEFCKLIRRTLTWLKWLTSMSTHPQMTWSFQDPGATILTLILVCCDNGKSRDKDVVQNSFHSVLLFPLQLYSPQCHCYFQASYQWVQLSTASSCWTQWKMEYSTRWLSSYLANNPGRNFCHLISFFVFNFFLPFLVFCSVG